MSEPATNGDDTATNGDTATIEPTTNGDAASHVDVKPDIQIKSEFQFANVKEDPDGEQHEGRRTRKVKKPSLAEISDSGESETSEPPKKRGRQSVGKSKASNAKSTKQAEEAIVKNGLDPKKSARIVLENIDAEIGTPPPKPSRGRGKSTPASAGRGRGRGQQPASKKKPTEVSEEEFEEEEDIEESEEDFEDLSDESEDEWVDKKKKKKPPKSQTPVAVKKKGGKGRPTKKSAEKEDADLEEEEEEEEIPPIDNATVNDLSGPVRTGQFLIEKVDLKRQENYPIWRMEGPNMLRKFEMVIIDGKVRHKSLYAYTSWAQTLLDLYTRIQVEQLANADGEITVEVKDEYVPKPPSLEELELVYGGDELFEPYKVFMKALLNQAAKSEFLSSIRENGDSSYLDPISKFDTLICQVVKRIESLVNMKEEFMTRVKNCPNMKSIKRENWSQTDQATVDKVTEKGVRSVLMFGYGYDPFLMTEDSSRGVEVAQEIIIGNTMEKYLASYHGLIHFKFNMLKRCEDKLKVEKGTSSNMNEEEILNKSIDDQGWILQTFEHLKNLMAV